MVMSPMKTLWAYISHLCQKATNSGNNSPWWKPSLHSGPILLTNTYYIICQQAVWFCSCVYLTQDNYLKHSVLKSSIISSDLFFHWNPRLRQSVVHTSFKLCPEEKRYMWPFFAVLHQGIYSPEQILGFMKAAKGIKSIAKTQ